MKIKNLKKNKGFTLIEMMVAVFIFSVALAALMNISAKGLQAARYAQDEVRADYLALEGIEIVRNIRDQAFIRRLDSGDWDSVFNSNGCLDHVDEGPENSCGFELDPDVVLFPCNDCVVEFSNQTNVFAQFDGTSPGSFNETQYTRNIRIERVVGGLDEVIVSVKVTWPTGSVEYVQSLMLWLIQ